MIYQSVQADVPDSLSIDLHLYLHDDKVADSSVIWLKPGTDLAQAFSTTRGSHVQMSSVLAADMSEPELRRDFIRLAMCQQAAVYSHTGCVC